MYYEEHDNTCKDDYKKYKTQRILNLVGGILS